MSKSAEPNGIFASADMHYSADSMVNSVLPLLSTLKATLFANAFPPLQTDYITTFDYCFVSLHSDDKNGSFVLCGCYPDLYQ